MRDSYLLAVGLLTGLTLPASALPQISDILPDNSSFASDLKQSAPEVITEDTSLSPFSNQLSQAFESLPQDGDEKSLPTLFNVSFPEFSSQPLSPSKASQSTNGEKNIPASHTPLLQFTNQESSTPINSFFNLNSQPTNQLLTSGNQLYYYRLAALKTGQIYTRQDGDSDQSLRDATQKQQLTYDDWKSLLALEAKAIAQGQGKNRLSILVGDSLSMWFPREKLPSGKLWLNQGISGDTSTGIANRLTAFSYTRPDAIYIMAGINDLRKGTSDEVILRNHRQMVRRLRQSHPRTQIFIQSILPTHLPTISNSRIREINTKLAQIAKKEKVNYLDIHSWFADGDGNLRSDLTTDGLHLSADGYDVWRFAIQQVEFKLSQNKNVDR
ncbi:SGNH/GDSL hydrolase family protein [Nostoc parmelioides]|uniref:G-D-S-L family lipolytic protein n=1 Tax=Nostoc parmelioides FACHB-3921 TaxID=2692909 RepID=A0ABR8BHX2_9NOSO|nr:SGNH/GDSL hydrolase family protein [Nostoc parmelioides]MBD2253505.1 G-D-S-L family lipolytic protein [Nostoc parmelioides FACHB-3921]